MTERPVLAAVSSVSEHTEVLRWAAEEAVRRGRPLRLLHVYRDVRGWAVVTLPGSCIAENASGLRNDAEGLLNSAAVWVRGRYPELPVTSVLYEGDPATALAEESERAEVLVLGRHDRGAVAELVLGSVATALVTRSACPVVAVPLDAPQVADRVVVGVDGTELSAAALGFAYRHAERGGLDLHVVHSWPSPLNRQAPEDRRQAREEHRRYLAEAMAGFAQEYPTVHAAAVLTEDDPAEALLRRSHRAALLVLGSRGRGRLAAAVLGSVSRVVLRLARCPIAVVRHVPVAAHI
ncbi:nucleotide-binding universal stress UspA family protein [Crossiella equi]|uniref:Nucleotide-binding universal stress UspA family protein n=1 Tax=Crossiella equi TaxID=130796 RepID=A0ABS5A5H2_9PSEU|nr:universal stress protein [Crossiella equi]MBP2471841.1 nucleotide-binding universal stress UspA family protein [Crossiella equi]